MLRIIVAPDITKIFINLVIIIAILDDFRTIGKNYLSSEVFIK